MSQSINQTDEISTVRSSPVSVCVQALIGRAQINAGDVVDLRRAFNETANFGRADAEALFAIEREAETCEEWTAFFVEAITDLVVWQARPTGVIDAGNSDWLMAQADASRTINCFALLVNVLAEAHRIPAWLPAAVRGRAANWPGVKEALRNHMAQAA